ncbi:hypothetical protein ACP3WT_28305, partial [Salmonella enterica]
AYLHSQGVHFRFNTLVHGTADGRLSTTAGEFRAERVVVCSGHDYLPTARAVHAEIEAKAPLLNKHGIHLL